MQLMTVLWRHRGEEVHGKVGIGRTSVAIGALADSSTRVQNIQAQMTDRALELLALPQGESAYVLDIGCGSGLSGELLDEDGHIWVGVDIAPSMLGA